MREGQAVPEALPSNADPSAQSPAGTVQGIYVANRRKRAVEERESVRAFARRGLEGDRYLLPEGAPPRTDGADITLIEAEALEDLARLAGIILSAGEHRRNLVTRGVALDQLAGQHFAIGAVQCLGVSICEPCWELEKMSRSGVLRGLVHRGGLRASILTGGRLTRGDSIEILSSQS